MSTPIFKIMFGFVDFLKLNLYINLNYKLKTNCMRAI